MRIKPLSVPVSVLWIVANVLCVAVVLMDIFVWRTA
jgi:hypothetical protein